MTNTTEILELMKGCTTAEEIIAIARESGTEISVEDANTILEGLKYDSTELSDKDLLNAVGGCQQADIYKKAFDAMKKVMDALEKKLQGIKN